MKVKILYDNEAKRPLKSDWGFAAFIEGEEKILFDTGNDGDILESNMQKMDVDPSKIDKVVLSHEHHDHTGGLFSIIDESME
ncbi:MAG: MBL fold metallo-hydrolase, partial [Candidatus Natronoplasma sp.]